jgi:hypothetical protein
MRTWTLNRQGIMLCTGLLLFFITAITPSLFQSSFGSSSPVKSYSQNQHSFASSSNFWNLTPSSPPLQASESSAEWTFDPHRDEHNFGLTDEKCYFAFPEFFKEIDRAVSYRKEANLSNVTLAEVDISWRDAEILRAMIYDRQASYPSER